MSVNSVSDVFRVVKNIVALDERIVEVLSSENAEKELSRQAAMDFENALLFNPELRNSFPQCAECLPLFEQRNALIATTPSTKLRTATVAELAAAADLIQRKEATERAIEKRLVALEPRLAGSEFAWQGALDTNLELPKELVERVPAYAELLPLADEKRQTDERLLATGLFTEEIQEVVAREAAQSVGKIRPRIKWWGISVELPHEILAKLLEVASAASGLSSMAGSFAGPQGKLIVTVLVAFVRVYSSVLEAMDRGKGIKLQIPWVAIYPLPQPVFIVPWPV